MIHIGNDIVDLKTPESMGKSADTRFVRRVLNLDEQELVQESGNPDALLWALWAAKETAFKAVSKSHPDISSAPPRYPVILDPEIITDSATGRVMTPSGRVNIKIHFHDDYVHCIGVFSHAESLESAIYEIGEIHTDTPVSKTGSLSITESSAVRRLAKKGIATHLLLKEQDIDIVRYKIQNKLHPPMVYTNGKPENMDISLSHDGRFIAYAFLADL